ncbi:MBL fold metallo-hydrolase [Sphingomonas sp. BE137]|jgi:glyoxylase-like metal-dependent hydrolase (beta-lactamase superfamily II)|uniref:MBL fold metallo-hydrolase n=1 Tax=Sphingomonas sp. BE137 TaxID=2817844 RepID=UPI001AE7F7F1|nr:MBL fold metallo-hydrolase [Sphingomonas sp. BE137]MDR6849298.1 glyoxylase-like metal-dependent hydrolase (beta-lactamase superfamily II) [Sphingomonas sp. BE137]
MNIRSVALAVIAVALLPWTAWAQERQPVPNQQLEAQAPGYYRVTLGDFKVTVLTDGTTPIPFGNLLHGANRAGLTAIFRDAGEPLDRETSINSFLIDTGEHRILIDAGAGRLFGDCCGRLPAMLKAAGYAPETIDVILLTHVHGDHSGGLTLDGQRVFPNATIYLSKSELDYWLSDAAKARAKASHQQMFVQGRAALAPYMTAGRIRTFDAPATLFPGIRAIAAPGHTPGHTFYEIESRGHRMRVVGDIIHAAEVQLQRPDITVDFDADEALAARTRKAALAELARAHTLVAAPHISFPGLGHIARSDAGYAWAPIPYSSVVRDIGQ